jgi:hypothetical protein
MLRLLAHVFVPAVLNKALKHQKQIGYKLVFKDLPPEWINGFMLVDMTKTWQKFGLPISGLNYFTLGAIENGTSTRLQSNKQLYQAWLGGYIFTSTQVNDWEPKDFIKLCEADQKKWLSYYGDPSPKMEFDTPVKVKDILINNIPGQLYRWLGTTHSDVGKRSSKFYNRAVMDGMAYIMNRLNPNLMLKGSNFIPSKKDSYEEVCISGYIAVMGINPKTKALLYVCVEEGNAQKIKMDKLLLDYLEIIKT